MSIIDEKYRNKYRGDKDWLATLIDANCVTKETKEIKKTNEDGSESTETVTTAKTSVDLAKLFALAEANNIKATEKYGDQVDRKNAPGRLRMTIGNMLRAAAKHRHGLFAPSGDGVEPVWTEADAAFLNGAEVTENRDGTRIVKVKPVEAKPAADAGVEVSEEA